MGISKVHSVAKYQKIQGEPLETENFQKWSHSAEKKSNGSPFNLVRFCMLC